MLGNVALSEALRWTKLSQQCFMASVYRQNTAGPDFDETSPSEEWRGRVYATKQVETYAIEEAG
jgi:hypothetical protein